MTDWTGLTRQVEGFLHLRTYPIAFKRLEKVQELEKIPRVRQLDRNFTFCQVPTLVRREGWTVGVTRDSVIKGQLSRHCARINGLETTTEEEISREADLLGTTWFSTVEEARKQVSISPVVPTGEAIVLAPLASGKFNPDVILIYGNPAQLALLMCGLQFKDYERFQFFFIGEGACADGLAQCYTSGKPALAIPCYGERRFGTVVEDEVVIALPPGMMGKAVEGLEALWGRGMRYPIAYMGAECDSSIAMAQVYPGSKRS